MLKTGGNTSLTLGYLKCLGICFSGDRLTKSSGGDVSDLRLSRLKTEICRTSFFGDTDMLEKLCVV